MNNLDILNTLSNIGYGGGYGMQRSMPTISMSPLTPPYLPSQRTTYDELGNDPA